MIKNITSKYMLPSKEFRRLSILYNINLSPNSSQNQLGRLTDLSSSMVNNYIKLFEKEGLITVSGETNRSQSYHITNSGKKMLIQSLFSYSTEIVQLYSFAKSEIATLLTSFYDEGIRKVVLFGAAETAEIVCSAIRKTPLNIIGVIDSDESKQGKSFNEFIICGPEKLNILNPDAVIITSFARQDEIYNQFKKQNNNNIKIKRLSDIE